MDVGGELMAVNCGECGGSGWIVLLTSRKVCLACKANVDGLSRDEFEEWLKLHPNFKRVDVNWGELTAFTDGRGWVRVFAHPTA